MQLLEKDENLLAAKIVAVVVAAAAGLGTGAAVVETEFEVGYCCLEKQRPRVVRVGESEAERAYAGTGPDEASNECVQKVRICCITNEKKIV